LRSSQIKKLIFWQR